MVNIMINSSLEELFNAIENSDLYKEYKKMSLILEKDKEINKLLDKIKELEKQATYLEYIGDESYKEVDKEIKELEKVLNQKPAYREYLNKMEEFNNELSTSSKMIESYIAEKV